MWSTFSGVTSWCLTNTAGGASDYRHCTRIVRVLTTTAPPTTGSPAPAISSEANKAEMTAPHLASNQNNGNLAEIKLEPEKIIKKEKR